MSEAQEIIDTAVQNQPKLCLPGRRGCLRGCLIVFILLALPVWWFCLHTTPLRVSKETTYVLGPMTSDGKRIDYFRAMEERYYPPEMKTDDNGYRLIVRACGATFDEENVHPELIRQQIYEKLGLDPNIKPTMKPIESPWKLIVEYDKEHPPAEGEKTLGDKYGVVRTFWTFDEFPMFKDWLEENTAGIDMLAKAVRKPAFFIPYVREHENTPAVVATLRLDIAQTMREWARAAHARAHYRLGIGDIDGAINDIVTLHHLGRHAGKQGTFVAGFVGIAIEGLARSIGIGNNPKFPPTKEQIERLIAELDALPPRWTLEECLESERYYGLAVLQDLYWGINPGFDDDPFPYFRLLFPGLKWTLDINLAMAKQNKVYDAMTIPGATIDGETLEEFLEQSAGRQSAGSPYNPLPLLFVRSRTDRIMRTLMSLFIPAVQAGREAWRRNECLENMQRLTLALLLYEKEHGSLPEGDWREAIRPYLGEDADRYFQCPSHRLGEGETNYAMIGGVENGVDSPNRILIAEVMQPQRLGEGDGRLPVAKAQFGNYGDTDFDGLGSRHPGGINIGMRSGGLRFISVTTKPDVLQSLLDGTATALP